MRSRKAALVGGTYSGIFLGLMLVIAFAVLAASGRSPTAFSSSGLFSRDLVGLFSALRRSAGDRVFDQAVIGREGWIYLADKPSMQDYQHTVGLRTGMLESLQMQLDRFSAVLKDKEITLVVVITPDKSSIYPQYMPREIPVLNQSSRLDDFVAFMKAQGSTRIVDLRAALMQASAKQQLYYKTDTHWTDLGAYYAYAEIMNALSEDYPILKPRPLSDFEYRTGPSSTMDLSRVMGLWSLQEESVQLVPRFQNQTLTINFPLSAFQDMWFTTNTNPDLPRLLVFRDSFYFSLAKFIEPHFSRTTVLHYNRLGENATLDDWVRATSPDVVIVETLERSLEQILPVLQKRP